LLKRNGRPAAGAGGIGRAALARTDKKFRFEIGERESQREKLQVQLEAIGFTKDAQERAAALFFQAVEERLNTDDPFRQALVKSLSDCVPSPFISFEDLNLVEMLAKKVQELENNIAYVKNENLKLAPELLEEIAEETFKPPPVESKSPKRSTINECLLEPDLEAEDAYYNQKPYTGGMEQYLKAMGDDLDD
jgi:hypothetical protein